MSSSNLVGELLNRSAAAQLFIEIATARPFLNEAELAIANYILRFPREASEHTAHELAKGTGTSEASVFRFCHTFGFAGFTALRDKLKQATADGAIQVLPITDTDDWMRTVEAAIMAILGTAIVLEPDTLSDSARAVARSKSVNVCGMGPISARLAEMLSFSLQSVGIPSFAWIDSRASSLPENFTDPMNSAIGISHSGTNEQVAEFLARARRIGAPSIALTNYPSSKVGTSAQFILNTGIWEDSYQMLGYLPRIAEILILSCFVQQVSIYRSYSAEAPSEGSPADPA